MNRRKSKKVYIGNIAIGGNSPITVQSMLNVKTTDVENCLKQIDRLKAAGCDLIRLAVPDEASAKAFGDISKKCGLPLIADIHYNYALAHAALDNGAKKIRMNPGNMRDFSAIANLAEHMKDEGVPVRVGVNGGSLGPEYEGVDEATALVDSALDCADAFEKCGFHDIVIAIKSSDTMTMIEANRRLAAQCDYPIHLGVTEAGAMRSGLIKSSLGIGLLLSEGIGDTIRFSLSADPTEEVLAARVLLKSLKLDENCVEVVSCPTCARTEIDVAGLAEAVERATAGLRIPLRISVMGCPLNGIGEGRGSDLGIAGGATRSVIMRDGAVVETVDNALLMPHFMALVDEKADELLSKSTK